MYWRCIQASVQVYSFILRKIATWIFRLRKPNYPWLSCVLANDIGWYESLTNNMNNKWAPFARLCASLWHPQHIFRLMSSKYSLFRLQNRYMKASNHNKRPLFARLFGWFYIFSCQAVGNIPYWRHALLVLFHKTRLHWGQIWISKCARLHSIELTSRRSEAESLYCSLLNTSLPYVTYNALSPE